MPARDRGKLPAIALAVALTLALVGTALSTAHTDGDIITTGHTTYLSAAATESECFAGITGILSQRVTWFNGVNLFARPVDGDGDTYMYVMEHFNSAGADGTDNHTGVRPFDPTEEEVLYETGNEWHLEDPNNPHYSKDITWVVKEYYALKTVQGEYSIEQTGTNSQEGPQQRKVHVYVVQVGSPREDKTINREYNFITTVDTCKFLHDGGSVEHNNTNDENPREPYGQHDPGADPGDHHHGEYNVDLFVGGKPDSIPAPGTNQVDDPQDSSGSSGDGGGSS